MSIPGSYYIIEVSKADRLAPGKTREPLNPSDTSNLRRNKEGTQFVINSTETIPGANYVNKFASRADMIAYINSNADWILPDMTSTRSEQASIEFTISGTQRNSLVAAWLPKIIMRSASEEGETVGISENFIAGNPESVEGANVEYNDVYIRQWDDAVSNARITMPDGAVGGDGSASIRDTMYATHSMIFLASTPSTGLVLPALSGSSFNPLTIMCSFQPSDLEAAQTVLIGKSITTTGDDGILRFILNNTGLKIFLQKFDEENRRWLDLHTFDVTTNDVNSYASARAYQQKPVFIQLNEGVVSIPVADEAGSYSTPESNQVNTEELGISFEYPQKFNNTVLANTDNRNFTFIGSHAIWNANLTNEEMGKIRTYLLTL